MSRKRAAAARLPEAAPAFAALGDATRLRIVGRLGEGGPASTSRLTQAADVSRQAVTKHLQALEAAGLVQSTRAGRERIWELRTRRLAEIGRHLEQISGQWDSAIERLRDLVESKEG